MTQTELFVTHRVGNLVIETPVLRTVPPLPTFARESETSRQAAIAKYDRNNSGTQRGLILEFLRERGEYGATREEIQIHLNLSGDSVRPRIKELLGEAKGWTEMRIQRSGLTRRTMSGEKAEVLMVIEGKL